MSFDLPRDTVFAVSDVRVALDPAPHPFEVDNAAAIATHWREASAANPALFDGEVALLSALALRGGVLVGRSHLVRYSSFLYWRKVRPVGGAGHVFAHAMPVSSDGALVAIRMGEHTINAGRIYFAAGSFERIDFRNGMADPEVNMRREVMEETGLDLSAARADPHYHAVSIAAGTVLFRRYYLDETADALAAHIRAHVARETDPEIDGPVILRAGEPEPDNLAPQMPPMLEWHFGERIGSSE